jgi:hypothetical protein
MQKPAQQLPEMAKIRNAIAAFGTAPQVMGRKFGTLLEHHRESLVI